MPTPAARKPFKPPRPLSSANNNNPSVADSSTRSVNESNDRSLQKPKSDRTTQLQPSNMLEDVDRLVPTAFLDIPGFNCVQTSWVGFELYRLDWGPLLGGKIEAVRAPHVGVINGLQVILPPLPDGGIEDLVGVGKGDDMQVGSLAGWLQESLGSRAPSAAPDGTLRDGKACLDGPVQVDVRVAERLASFWEGDGQGCWIWRAGVEKDSRSCSTTFPSSVTKGMLLR